MKTVISHYCRSAKASACVIAVVLSSLLGACGGPGVGVEEQVRQWVSSAEEAAEARERRALLDLISPAYQDGHNYDRDDIDEMLRAYFLRRTSVELITSIDEVRLYGDSAAEIDLTLGLAGANDGVFGFSADAYNFQLELVLDGSDWLLIAARWSALGGDLH